jgi:hypothetical protein
MSDMRPTANHLGDPTMTTGRDDRTTGATIAAWRRPMTFLVGAIVVAALALPVFAADPSASPSSDPSASAAPQESAAASPSQAPAAAPTASPTARPAATPPRAQPSAAADEDDEGGKPGKGAKKDKGPEVAITLRGTVTAGTDGKGRPAFSLSSGGTTYELEAGPPWFWGANNPLATFAGKTVTITGETRQGSTEVDVLTVNGTAIREPGRPPWAGGWKAVGEKHPGWSQEKADRFKAKFGDCFPPGQCKAKPSPGTPDSD